MSTLRDALFRIEPTRGLVSYTEDVKPYHTKILDVLIEYVYEERIDVSIAEKWRWEIHWDERWDEGRDVDWLAGLGAMFKLISRSKDSALRGAPESVISSM